jgi:hypothetical protein
MIDQSIHTTLSASHTLGFRVKQVVYRAPKPLTPAEQTAEVENIFATVITDKIKYILLNL